MVRVRMLARGLGVALLLLAPASACDTEASACHREAIARLGCCPTCDGDCRAKVSETCAGAHDVPLAELDEEPEGDESSGDGGPSDGLDEPR